MANKTRDVSLLTFFKVALIAHATFAIPSIILILLLDLIDLEPLIFILAINFVIALPISVAEGWLLAKGSNWTNTPGAITAVCMLPAGLCAVLLGGLLGSRWMGAAGGVVLAILFYLGARILSLRLGKALTQRYATQTNQS